MYGMHESATRPQAQPNCNTLGQGTRLKVLQLGGACGKVAHWCMVWYGNQHHAVWNNQQLSALLWVRGTLSAQHSCVHCSLGAVFERHCRAGRTAAGHKKGGEQHAAEDGNPLSASAPIRPFNDLLGGQ